MTRGPRVRHLVAEDGSLVCRYKTKVSPRYEVAPWHERCPACHRPVVGRWSVEAWDEAAGQQEELEVTRRARVRQRGARRARWRRRWVVGVTRRAPAEGGVTMRESEWGAAMRKLRRRLGGISQVELAQQLGVHVSTLRKWEQGRTSPSLLAHRRIRRVQTRMRELAARRAQAREEAQG